MFSPSSLGRALVFASQFHRPLSLLLFLSLFLPVVFAGDCLEWRRELPQYPISEQSVLLSHAFYLLPPPRQQQEWASSLKHCRCNSCSVLAIASFYHRYVTLFLILELASWKGLLCLLFAMHLELSITQPEHRHHLSPIFLHNQSPFYRFLAVSYLTYHLFFKSSSSSWGDLSYQVNILLTLLGPDRVEFFACVLDD